jgi:hypothetical protein
MAIVSGSVLSSWTHALAQTMIGAAPSNSNDLPPLPRPPTTSDRLATLPTSMAALIFAFVDGEMVTEWCPNPPQLPVALFATLESAGATCFQPAIDELRHTFDATVVAFNFDAVDLQCAGTVESRLVARLGKGGHRVRCLRLGLEMFEYRSNFEVIKARAYAEQFDAATIDWERVFANVPKLVRLDISGLPLQSTHVALLLRVASAHCHEIQSLVMPEKEWYRGPVGMDACLVMRSLYGALAQWHGHNGGLRQLTIPHRTAHPDASTTRQSLADELLLSVAAYCPKLEHFDGWKVSLRESEGNLRCDERINCSLDVWIVFSHSCRQLQEIQWCIFPFLDAYFQAFAMTPHPHLRTLTLATNASSFRGITTVREDDEEFESLQRSCSASSVFQAIAACPSLEQLTVLLQEELTDHGQQSTENIVSDALIETLKTHCPRLQRLQILQTERSGTKMYTRDHSNQGISDHGFSLLASQLPELRAVEIDVGSHCGADGLLALIASAPRAGPAREIELIVGSYDSSFYSRGLGQWKPSSVSARKNCIQFHAVLLEFLGLVVAHAATLHGRRFRLELRNGSSLYVDDEDAWQYQLEATVEQLRVHCPALQLHIYRQGGVASVTLSQTNCQATGSITGVIPLRRQLLRESGATRAADWSKAAWRATAPALVLTAVLTYKAGTRLA